MAKLTMIPNFTNGINPTIEYSLPTVDYYELEVGIQNAVGTVTYVSFRPLPQDKTRYTFTLTAAEWHTLRSAITYNNSVTVRFALRTRYASGGEWTYHNVTRTFTWNKNNPILTAQVYDTNSKTVQLTGDNTKLIKYHSNASAGVSATAQEGAAIDLDMYVIRNYGDTQFGQGCIFEQVEYNEFWFSAQDNLGNIGQYYIEAPMVEYIRPTCTIYANRPDALGNMSVVCGGIFFNGSFGAVSNTLTVQCRYAVTGSEFDDNWTNMTITKNGNSYYAYAEIAIDDFNQQGRYDFQVRAVDELETVTDELYAVRSIPLFHWGENDFVFEVPVTFNAGGSGLNTEQPTYDGSKTITGDLRLKGAGNYGNTLYFGDGSYCYITEASDDIMTIRANRVNFLATNGVYVEGYALPKLEHGTWAPYLGVNASYTTQYGWYSKMNQYVTVGFVIKATVSSGYESTDIKITGLPFSPMFTAAGGGMCSGAYVSGGFNFQCFVAETNGNITARVQSCNHTSQTNLSTSASGCKYRSGGGEITLSGTISFMTST